MFGEDGLAPSVMVDAATAPAVQHAYAGWTAGGADNAIITATSISPRLAIAGQTS
jgi:hypothetical protein